MLFKNFYNNYDQYKLNEGNFVSKDFTGLFDSDAKFRLTELTIDKLFEGLDLDKSEQLHSFIKSNIPSTALVLGKENSTKTSAFELVKSQISYIDTRILAVQRELSEAFKAVLDATQSNYKERTTKISAITNPSGISSIIPRIDEAVKSFMQTTKMDFKSQSVKQSFISLYNLDISKIIKDTLTSLEQSSASTGLKGVYTKIDSLNLQEIEADTVKSFPKILVATNIEPFELILSEDVYDRLAAFYEIVIGMTPFGQQLVNKFEKNYTSIEITADSIGLDVIMAMKQFIPSVDIGVFEPMSTLLNEVSTILLKRVFLQSPDEDLKNIFVPSLQVMYLCLLSIVSLKLINLNLEVEEIVVKKEEEIKKQKVEKKYNAVRLKAMNVVESVTKLEQNGFFTTDKLVYKLESRRMNPDSIKHINNFLIFANCLDRSKYNSEIFDTVTEQGVKKFQRGANAILIDGKIGRETKGLMKGFSNAITQKYAQGPKSIAGQTSFMDMNPDQISSVK